MPECTAPALREVLVDYVAHTLPPAMRAEVEAHVGHCAECTADLTVIARVRAATPQVPLPDIDAIIARVPRPSGQAMPPDVISLHARRRRPLVTTRVLGLAATIALMTVSGWSAWRLRSGGLSALSASDADTAALMTTGESSRSGTGGAQASGSLRAGTDEHAEARRVQPVAVSFGNPGDLTDAELQRVLDRLDKWDGAPATEAIAGGTLSLPGSPQGRTP